MCSRIEIINYYLKNKIAYGKILFRSFKRKYEIRNLCSIHHIFQLFGLL